MNDIELDDFLKKIETGLQESRKQLLNEYALRNDSLVVGDDNGNVLEVPAKEILARHPELVCGNSMEYIDFTQKRIELHEEMENAIRSLMKDKGVWEIDLTEDECWQPFDIQDTMVACTIDSVYDAVYERLNKNRNSIFD